MIFLFLVSSHISLSEESSFNDTLLGIFNKDFHFSHCSFEHLTAVHFHVYRLVLVESSKAVVIDSA